MIGSRLLPRLTYVIIREGTLVVKQQSLLGMILHRVATIVAEIGHRVHRYPECEAARERFVIDRCKNGGTVSSRIVSWADRSRLGSRGSRPLQRTFRFAMPARLSLQRYGSGYGAALMAVSTIIVAVNARSLRMGK